MTPVWHDGPLETLAWDGASPVAWSVAEGFSGVQDARAGRRRLASTLIGMLAELPGDRVRLGQSDAGAPTVEVPSGWHLGLSSRGAHNLIGIATAPIAVDRELLDGEPPLWDMLTNAESRDLRQVGGAEQPAEWLRRWTIKEAHAKLVGQPRRIAPEAIETAVADAVHATARFEGVSRCWTRRVGDAFETVAQWDHATMAPAR